MRRRHTPQQRLDEGIVRAPQHQHVGVVKSVGEGFRQINPRHLFGYCMLYPAFLDQEKEGERALYCLETAKGTTKWKAPLKLNPWGGASVHEQTVVVTGSTIGYDTNALKGAKGQIAAFDLAGGNPKWKKDIATGGIVSCAGISAAT